MVKEETKKEAPSGETVIRKKRGRKSNAERQAII